MSEYIPFFMELLRTVENFRQNDFSASRHGMKIHLPVHLIAAHNIVFDGVHAALLNDDLVTLADASPLKSVPYQNVRS